MYVDSIADPALDSRIKAKLKQIDNSGSLSSFASNLGIAGGANSLRNIMNTEGPLSVMDRGMLALHLLHIR